MSTKVKTAKADKNKTDVPPMDSKLKSKIDKILDKERQDLMKLYSKCLYDAGDGYSSDEAKETVYFNKLPECFSDYGEDDRVDINLKNDDALIDLIQCDPDKDEHLTSGKLKQMFKRSKCKSKGSKKADH